MRLLARMPPDSRLDTASGILRVKESGKCIGLSEDVTLAARDALIHMIDWLVTNKGLSREQAYCLSSVAVDLRIGNVVDVPNFAVSAILDLGVFTK